MVLKTEPCVQEKSMIMNQTKNILVHSLNVNGLHNKCNKVKDFIKLHNVDILLLQEVHICDKSLMEDFFSQHDMKILINKVNNQHNNYNGTAFIFNKRITLNYKIETSVLDFKICLIFDLNKF